MAAYLLSVVCFSVAAFYPHAEPYFPNEIIEDDDDDIGLDEQEEQEDEEVAAKAASGCSTPPKNFKCGVPKITECNYIPPDHDHTNIMSPKRQLGLKIIGGKPTLYAEWPWVVAVVDNRWPKLPVCSATMISNHWAVTAYPQCIYGRDSKQMTLHFGQHCTPNDCEPVPVVKRGIQQLHRKCFDPHTLPNQCVVMLKFQKVDYSFSVLNICLPERNKPTENDKYGTYAIVAGWGKFYHTKRRAVHKSEILRELKVKIRKVFACQGMLIDKNKKYLADKLTHNFLCSGNNTSENPVCLFDIGGGMFRYNLKKRWVLNAVACNMVTCEKATNVPAIYYRIAPYLNWIDSLLATTGEVNDEADV